MNATDGPFASSVATGAPTLFAPDDLHSETSYVRLTLRNHAQPEYAVLYPFFTLIVGVAVFWILNTFRIKIPYAACMFIVGMGMGIGVVLGERKDQLSLSILQWASIDPELLLAVFLPGLIFREAIEVNLSVFMLAFWQIIVLAYPMVLVGTGLVAVVGTYVIPFDNWTLAVSATLGAILSSTDPAAVAAVLKEAGAPPRLTMHIAGESLLNDGSAYVFYIVFKTIAYSEMGHGDGVTWGEGVKLFFQMAFGGVAVGIACALVLYVFLYELDRRFERDYDVLQVVAALSTAYISYYIADAVTDMSGIVACTTTGIVSCALGKGLINDEELMATYLGLMEHSLNTLLFALGGVVWGVVISGGTSSRQIDSGESWAYLVVLFLLVLVIRFFIVALFYPLFSRIGLKSNWREAMFLSYGGLRGSVGIALAINFYRTVLDKTRDDPSAQAYAVLASQFVFMSGGISLLSLLVNGTTAGPILMALGLGKRSASGRNRALQIFDHSAEDFVVGEYARLMRQPRFQIADFKIIGSHVPFLKMERILAEEDEISSALASTRALSMSSLIVPTDNPFLSRESSSGGSRDAVVELRHLFLQLLGEAYEKLVERGELDNKEHRGFNADVLKQSVAFAIGAAKDEPLNDYEYTKMFPYHHDPSDFLRTSFRPRRMIAEYEFQKLRTVIIRCMCFIEGHRIAEAKLRLYVSRAEPDLRETGCWNAVERALEKVVGESQKQTEEAQKRLDEVSDGDMAIILSHFVATILIHRLISYVERNAEDGVLDAEEAHGYLDNLDRELFRNQSCSEECGTGAQAAANGSPLCCLTEQANDDGGSGADAEKLVCVPVGGDTGAAAVGAVDAVDDYDDSDSERSELEP